jgi:hypothetical protein
MVQLYTLSLFLEDYALLILLTTEYKRKNTKSFLFYDLILTEYLKVYGFIKSRDFDTLKLLHVISLEIFSPVSLVDNIKGNNHCQPIKHFVFGKFLTRETI